MSKIIDVTPPRRGFRFRLIMMSAVLAAVAWWLSDAIHPAGGIASAASGNWFLISLLAGTVSVMTALLSLLFTGRVW